YIECRLSPLARETLFNRDLTEFIDSYDGRMQEPVRLPAKIPLLLLLGAEGIAVGMATKIMPHNFGELLRAQIAYLRGEPFTLHPDFPRGGIIDATDYDHGNGRLRCRARLSQPDPKTIVVTELPYNLTTQNLIESIEKAAKANKLKIASINDYTAEKVEVEIKLARGVLAEETIDALYAFTDCELSVSPNLVTIEDNLPRQRTVEDVLMRNTDLLMANLERELRIELDRLEEKWHARKLEQIFIEQRLYKEIEEKINYKAVISTIRQSLLPFAEELRRKISGEDVERLLEIKIRRISRYDLNRQEKELREIEKQIAQIRQQLTDMVGFTIGCLDDLIARYGELFPRKSELRAFDGVDARAAALSNLTVGYHRESGFLGHKIKAEDMAADWECSCSEYDRLLLIFKDGLYKVINVPDKLFVGPDLYWLGVVKNDLVFNLIYRHGQENLAYVKRFAMPKFIIGREYRLFEENKRSSILLLLVGKEGLRIRASLAPSARARYNAIELDLDEVLIKGVSARGKRMATRTVRKVVDITGTAKKTQPTPMDLPGIGSSTDEPDHLAKE
ncbi:MAG: DNA topoisomerase IV subunit A, partial [Desulfobulbus sp.]|nr:DNA topoisomerase IV subunit A [Desulfobulbus sp.]